MPAPITRAVTERWHKEHCLAPVLQKHSDDRHIACSTCGQYIQIPVKENTNEIAYC